MFNEIIKIEKKEQIRYGTTIISFDKTFGQIIKLLRRHRCSKILLIEETPQRIAFELDSKPYIVTIPRVYINNIYNDKIGIRIVFRYLETLLELAKQRVIDFDTFMLGSRIIETPQGTLTLKDAVNKLPMPKIFLIPENIEEEN